MSRMYQRRSRRPVQRKEMDLEMGKKAKPKGNAYRVNEGAMTPDQVFQRFGDFPVGTRIHKEQKHDNIETSFNNFRTNKQTASYNSKSIQKKNNYNIPIQRDDEISETTVANIKEVIETKLNREDEDIHEAVLTKFKDTYHSAKPTGDGKDFWNIMLIEPTFKPYLKSKVQDIMTKFDLGLGVQTVGAGHTKLPILATIGSKDVSQDYTNLGRPPSGPKTPTKSKFYYTAAAADGRYPPGETIKIKKLVTPNSKTGRKTPIEAHIHSTAARGASYNQVMNDFTCINLKIASDHYYLRGSSDKAGAQNLLSKAT